MSQSSYVSLCRLYVGFIDFVSVERTKSRLLLSHQIIATIIFNALYNISETKKSRPLLSHQCIRNAASCILISLLSCLFVLRELVYMKPIIDIYRRYSLTIRLSLNFTVIILSKYKSTIHLQSTITSWISSECDSQICNKS